MRSRSRIERPFSVYLTCGLIFFEVIIQLSYLSDAYRREQGVEPVWLVYTLLLCALATGCGGFMLLGANWARILFIAGCFPLFVTYEVGLDGPVALVRGIIPGVLCLLILSQRSNLFFTGRSKLFAVPEPYRLPRRERSEY